MATKKSEPRQKRTTGSAEATSKRRARAGSTGDDQAATKDTTEAAAKPSAPRKKRAAKAAPARDEMSPSDRSPDSEDGSAINGGGGGGDDDVIEVTGEIVNADDDGGSEGDDSLFGGGPDSAMPPPSSTASVSSGAALSRTDPLQAYLREVQRHPLLTPEEEKQLTVHYTKTGDVATAARLVTANLRLVVKLAYEYRRAYRNIMDLIQEGNIGLMQAVKRYDPYRGVKLSSYAAWWIRAYILRFILNNWRLVKLGTTQAQRKLFFNLNKEKSKLSAMGIEPTAGEIARRLSVDEKEVVDMDRRLSSSEASLDAPVGDVEGRSIARVELMPSSNADVETIFESKEVGELVHDRLQRFRETLKGKDVVIFDKRMAAEDPLTLQELGDEFGISRERVRQLEARLTTKLRQYLKDELGDAVGIST